MTKPGWAGPILWALLAVILAPVAYLLINTTFMLYDDEGYVLITYQQFNAGGRLYTEIFSQYGPWPYLYHWLAGAVLQSPITHTLGRLLTLAHWIMAALGCGWIAGRLCHSRVAGATVALAGFGLLWQMTAEPSHPGGLICAMLAASTCLVVAARRSQQWRWLGIVLGATAGALVLTKVNVGLLFLAGAGGALIQLTEWPAGRRRALRALGAAALLAVPWGLMAPRLAAPWVLGFALFTTLALASTLALPRRTAPWPAACALSAAIAFVLALAGLTLAMAIRGTPPDELLHGVFIAPLQHPVSFMIGVKWPRSAGVVAVAVGLLTVLAGRELRQRGAVAPRTAWIVAGGRIVAAAGFIWHAQSWPTLAGVSRFLVWSLPLLPLFLIPLRKEGDDRDAMPADAVFLVACLAIPQVLHAYPVAGSQMGWGTFLLLPLFAHGLHDLRGLAAGSASPWVRRFPAIGSALLLLVTAGQLTLLARTGWQRYVHAQPTRLPGAEDIRPGDNARLTLRLMTLNAALHADRLFSYAGMYSYNLWSGVPTPTTRNATHWFWLLDDAAQQAIIDALRAARRSAVISNDGFDDYLARQKVPVRGPLRPWLREAYRPLLRYGHFEFLVPQGSAAAPFGLVELLEPAEGAAVEFPALLRTNVVLDGRPQRFVLQAVEHPWTAQAAYGPGTARVLLEPISREGRALGPAVALPLDRDVRGLFRVHIYAPARPALDRPYSLVLTGLDASGAVLCESVF